MEQIELRAETRHILGKKTKRLREGGLIPATLYGPRTDPLSLQLVERDLHLVLQKAGTNRLITLWVDDADKPRMTLAREIQRDVITQSLVHVDFYEVVMTEKITAEIPLSLVGEAPAVAEKTGLLVRGLDSVHVQCLPTDLVEYVEVDVSVLKEPDQVILVKDLVVSGAIEVLTSPEEVVVQVLRPRAKLLEEEVEALEVEVITAAREREEVPEEELEEAEEEAQAESEEEANTE